MLIYKGTNINNGKVYIGLTIRDFKTRLIEHKHKAKYETYYLYRAIRKHGWDSFVWEIIEDSIDSFDKLKERESYWISYYQSNLATKGYNLTLGGEGMFGFKFSLESRKKMSLSRTGIPSGMLGKNHSEETKQRISEATKGKNNPMYGMRGELAPAYGRKKTDEEKKAIGDANRGSKQGNAKLNEQQVYEIKRLLESGDISKAEIARRYGVSRTLIIHISQGKVWNHVA